MAKLKVTDVAGNVQKHIFAFKAKNTTQPNKYVNRGRMDTPNPNRNENLSNTRNAIRRCVVRLPRLKIKDVTAPTNSVVPVLPSAVKFYTQNSNKNENLPLPRLKIKEVAAPTLSPNATTDISSAIEESSSKCSFSSSPADQLAVSTTDNLALPKQDFAINTVKCVEYAGQKLDLRNSLRTKFGKCKVRIRRTNMKTIPIQPMIERSPNVRKFFEMPQSTPVDTQPGLSRGDNTKQKNGMQGIFINCANANGDMSKMMLSKFSLTSAKKKCISKLSLSKTTAKQRTVVCEPEFLTHEISSCAPIRNSTTLFDFEQDALRHESNGQQKTDEKSSGIQGKKPSVLQKTRNLTKKLNVIKQILCSEDEDEDVAHNERVANQSKQYEENNNQPRKEYFAETANKTHKFFHSKDLVALESYANKNDEPMAPPVTLPKVRKNRRSSLRPRPRNSVYEFSSQSQTSDTDGEKYIDPAADIIQKLIEEGKVDVAIRRKGAARPRLKRIAKPNKKKISKQQSKRKARVQFKEVKEYGREVETQNVMHQHQSDCEPSLTYCNGKAQNHIEQGCSSPTYSIQDYSDSASLMNLTRRRVSEDHYVDGTFSRLARSVLLNETGKSDVTRGETTNRLKLLDEVRKFFSTPLNDKSPSSALTNAENLSPIGNINRLPVGNTSPWRVNDNSHLPVAFHFSTNSSNLPSFSSEYIPPTPRKRKIAEQMDVDCSRLASLDAIGLPEKVQTSTTVAADTFAASTATPLSSFSSNDSNAENMPPLQTNPANMVGAYAGNIDENADIFNLRHNSNPRRALPNRSPLKTINILEVVTLPSWKGISDNEVTGKQNDKHSGDNASAGNLEKTSPEATKEDLFGFEDFIASETDSQETGSAETEQTVVAASNSGLRKRLDQLKKWRPDESELQRATTETTLPRIFNEANSKPQQRNIKEMLCSTMIHPTSAPANTRKQFAVLDVSEDASEDDDDNVHAQENSQEPDLFNTNEPQLTFNEKIPHRTYERPLKRKRKMHHNFLLFEDSEESEEEVSHEDNNEVKISKRHKKKKRQPQHTQKGNEELNSFVEEFNEMCKDVDSYVLNIE